MQFSLRDPEGGEAMFETKCKMCEPAGTPQKRWPAPQSQCAINANNGKLYDFCVAVEVCAAQSLAFPAILDISELPVDMSNTAPHLNIEIACD
ncbi:hypothetical protein [Bradyrhizobium japonicum]|uniref:hypothetical protein n=1 Tax=Bradyrhizobium japonicum TaxID=375 RepID=UPI001BAAB6D3|nr:hypothetical protein [Bradyrhizobium japonicum]MBR0914912.1 hypothetical protein [Bradyrhizobium japonicum]